MAIGFARAQPVQRSKGQSTIQRLAYLSRARLVAARTGTVFDFAHRGDLVDVFTLLPAGVSLPEGGAPALWNAVEMSSKRADANLGIELLLALPMLHELPVETSQEMVRAFVHDVIVDRHALFATVAVHAPHPASSSGARDEDGLSDEATEDVFADAMFAETANLHAHVLISPRQLTPEGLSRKRYTALDPVTRNGRTHGRHWGRLWRDFQNRYLIGIGSPLRVPPNPPVDLAPVPLAAIRRWRKRLRRDNPGLNGRDLLVNRERERLNRGLIETIDGALACFDEPFTCDELAQFYRRHVPEDIAAELCAATLGLGGTVGLSLPGSQPVWYASADLVHHELRCFGLALTLANRTETSKDVSTLVKEGFPSITSDLLASLFAGPDLVVIHAPAKAGWLAADIVAIAQDSGLTPVCVATAAGATLPNSVVRAVGELRKRMVSGALLLLDDADAITPEELSVVLSAGVAGGNKVVLIRRYLSDWTRLPLLDLLENHVLCLDLPQAGSRSGPEFWSMGKVRQALQVFQREDAIIWLDTSESVQQFLSSAGFVPTGSQAAPPHLEDDQIIFSVGSPALAVHRRATPSFGDFSTSDSLGSTPALPASVRAPAKLVVARDVAPTFETLADMIELMRPRSAITQPAAGHYVGAGRWPRFGVDEDEEITTTSAGLSRWIKLIATDSDQLAWAVIDRKGMSVGERLETELAHFDRHGPHEAEANRAAEMAIIEELDGIAGPWEANKEESALTSLDWDHPEAPDADHHADYTDEEDDDHTGDAEWSHDDYAERFEDK